MWKYNGNPIGSVLPPTVRDGDYNRPSRTYWTGDGWDYDALDALGYAWEEDPEPDLPDPRIGEIMNRLLEIDAEGARPSRAIAMAVAKELPVDPADVGKIELLETEADALRAELAALEAEAQALRAELD